MVVEVQQLRRSRRRRRRGRSWPDPGADLARATPRSEGYVDRRSAARCRVLSATCGAQLGTPGSFAGRGAGGPSAPGAGSVCQASEGNGAACDFSRVVLASTKDVWTPLFERGALPSYGTPSGAYRHPTLVVFAGATRRARRRDHGRGSRRSTHRRARDRRRHPRQFRRDARQCDTFAVQRYGAL